MNSIDLSKLVQLSNNVILEKQPFLKLFLFMKAKDNSISVFSPEVEIKEQRYMLRMFIDYTEKIERSKKIVEPFDIIANQKKNMLFVAKDSFPNVNALLDKMNSNAHTDFKGLLMEDFIAYAGKVTGKVNNKDEKFTFFGKFTSLSKVSNNGFMANLKDGTFKKVKDEVYGFSQNIDFVEFNKNLQLFGTISLFDRLFNMDEYYRVEAKKLLNDKIITDNIDDSQQLIEDIGNDGMSSKRLAKLSADPGRIKAFVSHMEKNISEVLDSKEITLAKFKGIEYDKKTGKLKYETKKKREFISLIADAPYKSIVGEQVRIDKSL